MVMTSPDLKFAGVNPCPNLKLFSTELFLKVDQRFHETLATIVRVFRRPKIATFAEFVQTFREISVECAFDSIFLLI